MKYVVELSGKVDFAPDSETAEILQNVRTILNTRRGSVPMARDFGISWDFLDAPLPVAKALLQTEIIDAVQDFEPRAKVEKVIYNDGDAGEGILKPRVIISIGGDD